MSEELRDEVRYHVAHAPVDQALHLIATELKQHLSWTMLCWTTGRMLCPEENEPLEQLITYLHQMNDQIVNELILSILLPRLQHAAAQEQANNTE